MELFSVFLYEDGKQFFFYLYFLRYKLANLNFLFTFVGKSKKSDLLLIIKKKYDEKE